MKHLRCLLLMLPLILICGLASAQKKIITGKVIDEKTGEPLVGANILIDNAKSGITTKQDGSYTITIPDGKNTLVFSYVGYTSQIIAIGDKKTINISLVQTPTEETEVVVIGYGTQKRNNVTGAVAKYKNDKLDQAPVSRLDQALQGKIAGVQIQNTSSEAGADPKVQIRGVNSINAGQSPFVVVDGQPVPDGLAFVNMSDVESVEVLKDAAAAAIYGSRGGSGVILITTKSGKGDKAKYNFKVSNGYKSSYNRYSILTSTEYLNMLYSEAALRATDTAFTNYATTAQRTAGYNFANTAEKSAYLLEKDFYGGVPTDWQSAALRTGNVKNVDLSVSGGSKDIKYYISGAYQNDQGMIRHSEYERFNIRSRIEVNLSKKVKITFNINPTYFKRERPSTGYTDFTRIQSYLPLTIDQRTLDFVLQNPANAGLKVGDFAQPRVFNDLPYSGVLPDGSNFTSTGANSLSSSANNSPYAVLETRKITSNDYRLLTSADLTYNILPGLTFKTLLSGYINSTTGLDFAKTNSNRQGDVSTGIYSNRLFVDLLNENTLNYTKQIKDHSFSALIGFTAEKTKIDSGKITGLNYISDNITSLNTALSISQDKADTYNNSYKIGLLSVLGRLTYAYQNKYLLTATFRADGSSKFAPGRKWGSFPSLSLGWVASKEKFLQNINWIDNLKFRASYGATGNNRINDFLFIDQLYSTNYPTGGGTGTLTQGLSTSGSLISNPTITWERTFQFNGGFDLSLFKNFLTVSLDVYQSKTEKLLLNQAALGIVGVPQVINNIGRLQNDGIELEISTNNIRTKNFKWTTSANIAHTQNKILELGNETYLINTGERQDVYLNQVGGPLIQYFNFKTDGVWNSQTDINVAKAKGLTSPLSGYFATGALKFKDVNNDNIIDLNDRVVIGNPYPDYTWGITNNFTFKGFDVSVSLQGVQGGQLLNGDMFYNEGRKYNRAFIENRWISPANPGDGKTPYFTNGYTNAWTQSDYIVQDASYWALREVLVGYSLPAKLTKKTGLNTIRFYFSAQNLYYHTAKSYNGINPEARNTTGSLYGSPLLDGYQRGAFPINQTFLFGLNLNF